MPNSKIYFIEYTIRIAEKMDNLPTEIIIDILVKTPVKDIPNIISTNKRIRDIYKENIESIYMRKIKSEYELIENEEDLYFILYNSQKEYEYFCKKKELMSKTECNEDMETIIKTVSENIKWIDIHVKDKSKRIPLIINLFMYVNKCLDKLSKNRQVIEVLKDTIIRLDYEISIIANISNNMKNRWKNFYETIGQRILNF